MDHQLGHWGSRWKAMFVAEGYVVQVLQVLVCPPAVVLLWRGVLGRLSLCGCGRIFVAWDGCAVVRSNVWDVFGGHFLGTTVDEGGCLGGGEKPGECLRNPVWRVHVLWGRCGNRMK
eukprot:scaffold3050_cov161-Cylindrotheca_fusiformis.AAC.2